MKESGLGNYSTRSGYVTPDNLVFLNPGDYERLNFDKTKFEYLRNREDYRNPFERDRARVLHSPFFRSLGGKSQVFDPNQSDFFRTRLTHSLEVAQIAKVMAIQICETYRVSDYRQPLSPWEQLHFCDLVEAVALAHDLGHPPFGHIGEDTLNKLMTEYGGFEANAQNLRILVRLDEAYAGRPNYTRGVLAGVMKYKVKRSSQKSKFLYDNDWNITEMTCPFWDHDKALDDSTNDFEFMQKVKDSRTLACQVMDLADEISYAGHDIEDVLYTPLLRYGIIENIKKIKSDIHQNQLNKICAEVENQSGIDLSEEALQAGWENLRESILRVFRTSNPSEFRSEAHKLRRMHMNAAGATCRVEKNKEEKWIIRISQEAALRSALIRIAVIPLIHHDSKVVTLQRKGTRVIQSIFKELLDHGNELLPWEYQDRYIQAKKIDEKARICCDFIDNMTEAYALRFYQRLFESEHGLLTDFF